MLLPRTLLVDVCCLVRLRWAVQVTLPQSFLRAIVIDLLREMIEELLPDVHLLHDGLILLDFFRPFDHLLLDTHPFEHLLDAQPSLDVVLAHV